MPLRGCSLYGSVHGSKVAKPRTKESNCLNLHRFFPTTERGFTIMSRNAALATFALTAIGCTQTSAEPLLPVNEAAPHAPRSLVTEPRSVKPDVRTDGPKILNAKGAREGSTTFSEIDARTALRVAERGLRSCLPAPRSLELVAVVRFEPTGKVEHVEVSSRSGESVEVSVTSCVESRLGEISVPSFRGKPVTLRTSLSL